jgi:hypothetical protein
MEEAMFIRVATAGATLIACSLIAVAGAGAQTATAPGKPIDLLHVSSQSDKAKPRVPHGHKKLSRAGHKTHLAAARPKRHHHLAHLARHAPTVAAAAPTPAPPPAWSDPPAATGDAPAAATSPLAPMAFASAAPAPSELMVGGQTVQVVSPDGANDMDLAADTSAVATAEPAKQSLFAAQAPISSLPLGSATWIAQVLAAIGGAVAAGSVAWFLIGYAPQRSYG